MRLGGVSLLAMPLVSLGAWTTSTAPADGWLDADQRRRADQLVSAFENSTTEIRYDYAENIDDGRGVTAGRSGFTTGTCDALDVVVDYTDRIGENVLSPFVPELERLCDEASDDTSGLPEAAYIAAWQEAAIDPEFRAVQDAILDRNSYIPAMEAADQLGLQTALARAQIYDTIIQHGGGDDPDGVYALIDQTNAVVGLPSEAGEAEWLNSFFDVRVDDLTNPANVETTEEWRESTDRVECMRRIASTGNDDLDGPITFTVYGDEFTID